MKRLNQSSAARGLFSRQQRHKAQKSVATSQPYTEKPSVFIGTIDLRHSGKYLL